MVTADVEPFGNLVRRYRRAVGLTQEELAERAGLSVRAIGTLERGTRHSPRRDTVELLADALELRAEQRKQFVVAARRQAYRPTPEMPKEPEAPSKLLTILIADVRGYTRYTQEQGDEAAARLASRFAEVVEEVVDPHGGELLELRGDEAMVVFSSAREAIRAGVELQCQLAGEVQRDPSLPLHVGIGLDTGDVIPVKGGYRGGALNLAARLCSLAGAGEIFASDGFVHLARKTEGCVYIDRGEVHLKGLTDPVRVIQITAEGEILPELPPLEQVLVSPPTNLPDEATTFIGREREIAEVAELVRQPGVRLVTLTGTGGTGKTRLAVQVAGQLLSQFEDGVFFVSLAALSDPNLVLSTIGETLGVKEQEDRSLSDTLREYLTSKHLLLVLDNFEHLLDAALVVAELLDVCRSLHFLVTSRIPLQLAREHEYAVPPFPVPDPMHLPDLETVGHFDSVALFIDRARAVKTDFQLTEDNAPAVAEICARLDGLPLAIVLAAARIKLFPPQALLQRLSNRLMLLTSRTRDRPARQQTLRNTIDWSFSLLPEQEQMLFARLSVFAGGCTFEAAEGVFSEEGKLDLLEGMASLVDKSLVDREGEEGRFTMLETLREYALERLQDRGETDELQRRHAEYYLALAEQAEPELTRAEQTVWLARLERDHENLRAALGWLVEQEDGEAAQRLAGALWRFWEIRGHLSEGSRWLERALSLEGSGRERPQALYGAGVFAFVQGDPRLARIRFEESLGLSREVGDKRGIALAVNGLGILARSDGESERAEALHTESLVLHRELGDKFGIARSLMNLVAIARDQQAHERARMLCEESLALHRELDNRRGMATSFQNLAEIATDQADYERATILHEESLALLQELGDRTGIARSLRDQGTMALDQGQIERARVLLEESLTLYHDLGDSVGSVMSLQVLGAVAVAQGDYQRAAALLNESLTLIQVQEHTLEVAVSLEGLAATAAGQGNAERAARLWGAAEELRHAIRLSRSPFKLELYHSLLAAARSQWAEVDWERENKAGRALTLEQAITYALKDDTHPFSSLSQSSAP